MSGKLLSCGYTSDLYKCIFVEHRLLNTHAHTPITYIHVQVLLRVDFGLDWWIPDGQLIPPLVNRANYIHWIEDLLQLSSPPAGVSSAGQAHAEKDKQNEEKHKENKQEQKEQGTVLGLDIGCGTNLIYPLLGCAINPHWRFVAVDITPVALQWARRNADANEGVLQGRVVVRESGQPPALGAARGVVLEWRWGTLCCGCVCNVQHVITICMTCHQYLKCRTTLHVPLASHMCEHLHVYQTTPHPHTLTPETILPAALHPGERFAFTMCNPPFFESIEQAGGNPRTNFAGVS